MADGSYRDGEAHVCPCVFSLLCVLLETHGKRGFRRVPEIMHTAKILAHGKIPFSGSDVSCQEALCVCSERRESASSAVRVRAVSVLLVISEYTRECFVSVICLCVRSSIHRERPTRVSAACVS